MNFDDLTFKSVTSVVRDKKPFIRLTLRKGTIVLNLNAASKKILNGIVDRFDGIDLLVASGSVFALKPKKDKTERYQGTFTATGLIGNIDNIPYKERLFVTEYKGMLVCDLNEGRQWVGELNGKV